MQLVKEHYLHWIWILFWYSHICSLHFLLIRFAGVWFPIWGSLFTHICSLSSTAPASHFCFLQLSLAFWFTLTFISAFQKPKIWVFDSQSEAHFLLVPCLFLPRITLSLSAFFVFFMYFTIPVCITWSYLQAEAKEKMWPQIEIIGRKSVCVHTFSKIYLWLHYLCSFLSVIFRK